MKKSLTLFALLSFTFMNAQYQSGTIYFKNGETKKGFIKKRNHDGIKFKENKDSKLIIYDHNHITGYDTLIGYYRYKNEYKSSPILFELLTRGKINLYSLQKSSPGSAIPGVVGATFGGGTSSYYFIEKGERFMKLGYRVNKGNLFYFTDCPILIKKIKSKEIKGSNVYEIIDFYNTHCD